MKTKFGRLGRMLIVALSAAMAVCGSAAAAVHRVGEIALAPGIATREGGRSVAYEIGTLYVPENRVASNSRPIGVGFARLKAARASNAPPIFILPGGPGRSYLNAFTDHDAAARSRLAELLVYAEAADVVVVDQRGWSRQGDMLEQPAPDQPLDQPRSRAAEIADMVALAKAAQAANPGKDLAGYTIVQCAEDVNDLRQALGYRTISLSGQSFGSQWSLAVMRLHPDVVTRAVLSGVEPLDAGFDMPSQVLASFQRLAFEADQDPALKPYLPLGGLMAALKDLRARFANAPISVTVADPTTGAPVNVALGLGDFQASLRRPPDDWPAFVLSLYYGRYEDWALETLASRRGAEGAVRLIEPLIDSGLGVSPARGYRLWNDPAAEILGFWDFEAVLASASVWPTPDVDDTFRKPVLNPTPVVFIHGDWDISTPIDNTLGLLPYFPNGRAILVHRGVHHAREPLFEHDMAVREAVIAFLRTGAVGDLPADAELPPVAFRAPAFPPPRR